MHLYFGSSKEKYSQVPVKALMCHELGQKTAKVLGKDFFLIREMSKVL